MGQVPQARVPHYALIGSGRLATHLARYFQFLNIPFIRWSRRTSSLEMDQAIRDATHVLLAVRDDAIVPLIEGSSLRDQKIWIHFSGSLSTPLAEGVHPLMSFGPSLHPRERYEAIPFITELGRAPFVELFPGLKNPSFAIPPGDKPFYHALCVMAGNFGVVLWQKLMRETAERWGVPTVAVLPFLRGVFENLLEAPSTALTGPLVRQDFETLERNMDALDGDPFQKVYGSVVRAYFESLENEKEADFHEERPGIWQ